VNHFSTATHCLTIGEHLCTGLRPPPMADRISLPARKDSLSCKTYPLHPRCLRAHCGMTTLNRALHYHCHEHQLSRFTQLMSHIMQCTGNNYQHHRLTLSMLLMDTFLVNLLMLWIRPIAWNPEKIPNYLCGLGVSDGTLN
jgi:hypothetical protein